MIHTNYHTHLIYCNHAIGHAEDYIQEALRHQFTELGITDHAPVLECSMSREDYQKNWCYQPMKLDTMYQSYLPEVNQVKKEYKDKISILTGFETEYIPKMHFFIEMLRSKVDYLNLGVHFFEFEHQVLNSYNEVNYKTIYGYLKACVDGMKTGLFNTLVHPDLFMFGYKDENGERTFDSHCEQVTREIIQVAIEHDIYLEMNANGIKNTILFSDGKEWLYPYRKFWEIVKEYPQAKIIIGADAHDPLHLAGDSVDQICHFAESIGLTILPKMEVLH